MMESTVCHEQGYRIRDLGFISYDEAYAYQKQSVQEVLQGENPTLIFCEHPNVLTLGRLAKAEYILASNEDLKRRGVQVRHIDRGGEVTLHCPGQLVVYPIFDLRSQGKDLKHYLNYLEQVAIDFFGKFAILATRFPGQTGVWVDNKKIASIGIGVKKWISFHGMSINVNPDLNLYSLIKPCGLDVQMTSMSDTKDKAFNMTDIKLKLTDSFYNHFVWKK